MALDQAILNPFLNSKLLEPCENLYSHLMNFSDLYNSRNSHFSTFNNSQQNKEGKPISITIMRKIYFHKTTTEAPSIKLLKGSLNREKYINHQLKYFSQKCLWCNQKKNENLGFNSSIFGTRFL